MGRIEWNIKDCMQSRQDYIIAVEERRDTSREEDSPGDAETHGVCRVTWRGNLSWRHDSKACGSSRSHEARRVGSVAWRLVR